jgi:hypothetical protein
MSAKRAVTRLEHARNQSQSAAEGSELWDRSKRWFDAAAVCCCLVDEKPLEIFVVN